MIKTIIKKDISGESFKEYELVLKEDFTTLTFYAGREDQYIVVSLKQTGEPANIDTYFGMHRKEAREFAHKLLRITK